MGFSKLVLIWAGGKKKSQEGSCICAHRLLVPKPLVSAISLTMWRVARRARTLKVRDMGPEPEKISTR